MRYFLFSTSIQQLHYDNFIKANPKKQKETILKLCKLKQSPSEWDRLLQSYIGSLNELIEEIYTAISALIKRKQSCNFDVLDIAFITGNQTIINQMLTTLRIVINKDLFKKAILCDNPNSLLILENLGVPLTYELMVFAAENGCLNILKHCVSRGLVPTKDTLDDAAFYGDLPTIQYLIEELDIQPTIRTIDYTILGSSIKPHRNRTATQYLFELLSQKADDRMNIQLAR